MVQARASSPSFSETAYQVFSSSALRGRVFTTLGLLLLVRLGIYIPIPGIDRPAFRAFIDQGGQLLGFLDIFTGGGISTLGLFALGILPFINASIIIQLLTSALPSLEDLQKNEGESGRRKISQYTRYLAVVWGLFQSVVFALILLPYALPGLSPVVFVVQVALALLVGSVVVMWVGEVITERGIGGQGASLLIFLNIISTLPRSLSSTIEFVQSGGREAVMGVAVITTVFLSSIVLIVAVEEASRRIPVVSAKRQAGSMKTASRQSYLPLKLNAGGVMPIIFASAVVFLPLTVANSLKNPALIAFASAVSPASSVPWLYPLVLFSLIIAFAYFYSSLIFNPSEVASNLKRGGVAIPGVRPGSQTASYLSGVSARLTVVGALFLGFVSIIPSLSESATGVKTLQGLGGTSVLILVGVAIQVSKQLQTAVISQRYERYIR